MRDVRALLKLESNGTLTVGAGKDRALIPFNAEIVSVSAVVGTAPTGASLIVDVLKNGTTIYTTTANRPTIAAGATQTSALTRPDVTKLAPNDLLTLSVSQIGSTVAGADLDVVIQYVAN
jgi:hypothetical protein